MAQPSSNRHHGSHSSNHQSSIRYEIRIALILTYFHDIHTHTRMLNYGSADFNALNVCVPCIRVCSFVAPFLEALHVVSC